MKVKALRKLNDIKRLVFVLNDINQQARSSLKAGKAQALDHIIF